LLRWHWDYVGTMLKKGPSNAIILKVF
jgi:hypothetical protein